MNNKSIERKLKHAGKKISPSSDTLDYVKNRLGTGGGFIPQNENVFVMNNGRNIGAKKRRLAVIYTSIIAVLSIALITFWLYFFPAFIGGVPSDTYISLDINPSVELIADKNNMVKEVRPLNTDAVELLHGENFVNMPVEDAVDKLVGAAEEQGYIDRNKTDNTIKIVAVNKNYQKEKKVEDGLINRVENHLKEKNIQCSVIKKFGTVSKAEARKNKLSVGKLEMIKASMEMDKSLSFGQAKKLSMKELNEIIHSYSKDEIDEATKKFENKKDIKNRIREADKSLKNINNLIHEVSSILSESNSSEVTIEKIKEAISKYNRASDEKLLIDLSLFQSKLEALEAEGKLDNDNIKEVIYALANTHKKSVIDYLKNLSRENNAFQHKKNNGNKNFS